MNIDLDIARQAFQLVEKVDVAYLCGSQAKGTATGRSDIDFAIVVHEKLSMMEENLTKLDQLSDYVFAMTETTAAKLQ